MRATAPGLHPDRVEEVREGNALPGHIGDPPAGHALEVLHEGGLRHRLQVVQGKDRRPVDETGHLQSIVARRLIFGKAAGDGVDAEAVAARQEAAEAGPKALPRKFWTLRAEGDAERAEGGDAEKDPSPDGYSLGPGDGRHVLSVGRHGFSPLSPRMLLPTYTVLGKRKSLHGLVGRALSGPSSLALADATVVAA